MIRAHAKKIVSLDFRDVEPPTNFRRTHVWKGFSVERVEMTGASEFSYDWAGNSHYIALHDLKLVDGETAMSEAAPQQTLDLCDRLTFAPKDCRVSGWSSLKNRANSFVALTFSPDMLTDEIEMTQWTIAPQPKLYFTDRALQSTMAKLQAAIAVDDPRGSAYAETLGLLAVLEINRMQLGNALPAIPDSGALSMRQERLVREFINENLNRSLSLAEVSGVAGLTRFHFTRAFSKTFGTSPHAYILKTRIEQAKELLVASEFPINAIAAQTGFNSQNHFAASFRSLVGCTPSQFRRASAS